MWRRSSCPAAARWPSRASPLRGQGGPYTLRRRQRGGDVAAATEEPGGGAPSWTRVELEAPSGTDESDEEWSGTCAAALSDSGGLGLEQVHGAAPPRAIAWMPPGTSRAEVEAALVRGGAVATVAGITTVEDPGWVEAFNRSLKPVLVGRRFVVVPDGSPAPSGRLALAIAPGRAFGTGHHESTRLAIEILEEVVREGARVLDVGTGSGILAAASARLGAREVLGLDSDPEAVEVARENLAGLPERAVVRYAVASDLSLAGAGWDVAVANIQVDVILVLLPALAASVRAGGALVLSGLLGRDKDAVDAALAQLAAPAVWRQAGEWIAASAVRT